MEEEAAKAYDAAEKRFASGDVAGAIKCARRLSSSRRDLANALAAYEVHAAAAMPRSRSRRGGGRTTNWYAVLGMGSATTTTHEEIKKQYRRLCLVLHPDKNRSAAAEGAFKLVHQAWEHLSARHKPGAPPLPCTGTEPDNLWSSAFGSGGSGTGGPPPPRHEHDKFDGDSSRPPPSARRSRSWQPRYARSRGSVFCGNCGSANFDAENDEESDEACRSCFGRVRRHHHQSKAEVPPAPAAQKANNNKPPPRRPRKPRSSVPIFCEKCGSLDIDEEDGDDEAGGGGRCHSCSWLFRPPHQSKAEAEATANSSPRQQPDQSPADMEEEVPPPPPAQKAAPPPRPPSQPPAPCTEEEEDVTMEEEEEPQQPRKSRSRNSRMDNFGR
ncbi:hypothetical protein PR202_gb10327 [Eleusine coracana subsp. coracana]|uniref:J domain-containing protein n=1 Tax=Eleusine coracana subsp. coracana TaxID=191504 RepID=A0AAV5EK39_ELECO|nr:hypothetical protein PR202_gb10327 [Eleusine coracana subsp. coracana]